MVALDPLRTKPPGRSKKTVVCLTCNSQGVFTVAGPNRVPAWLCMHYPICDSYVGVHPGTEIALGTMANAELRAERVKAHLWVDRLWRGKKSPTRKEVYQLVAQVIGVRHFHVAQCDMPLLGKLRACRADVERAFGRVAEPEVTDTTLETVSDLDLALMGALFEKGERRIWPTDPGDRAVAIRCVRMGYAISYIDAAGRRSISRTRVPTNPGA